MEKIFIKKFISILLILIISVSCSTNKKDIDDYVKASNTNALLKIIKDGYNNKEKFKIVDYAIKEIIINKLYGAYPVLEDIYFNYPLSKHKKNLIMYYSETKQVFKDSLSLLNLYIHKVLLKETQYLTHKKYIEKIISQYDKNFIRKTCLVQIKKSIKLKNYLDGYYILKNFKNMDIKLNKAQKNTLKLLKKIDKIEKGRLNTFADFETIKPIDKQIETIKQKYDKVKKENNSSIQKIKDEHSELFDSIDNFNRKIKSLRKEINESNYFHLNGYIISQVGKIYGMPEYEIKTNYGNRALLVTKETQYSTKGMFDLSVIKTGEKIVTLKQEFGGFEQSWDLYVEVTKDQIKERGNKESDLFNYEDKLYELQDRASQSNEEIDRLKNNLLDIEMDKVDKLSYLNDKRENEVDKILSNSKILQYQLTRIEPIIFKGID